MSLGVGNHGGSVCMCQAYMHTDALHNTGRENTDIEQVWERAHSQTPSNDEAIGLCLPVSSLPGPVSNVHVPQSPLCCSRAPCRALWSPDLDPEADLGGAQLRSFRRRFYHQCAAPSSNLPAGQIRFQLWTTCSLPCPLHFSTQSGLGQQTPSPPTLRALALQANRHAPSCEAKVSIYLSPDLSRCLINTQCETPLDRKLWSNLESLGTQST